MQDHGDAKPAPGNIWLRSNDRITYRADTAVANILRQVIKRLDEARTLLRALSSTEADIIPDFKAQM